MFMCSLIFCFQNIPMHKNPNTMLNHRSVDSFLFDNFAKELKDIKNFCVYHLTEYLEEIEGIDINIANLRITQSWLNRAGPNESHHPHHHPNSCLSGVLYIKCLQNDNIVFSNLMQGIYNSMEFPKSKNTEWNERNSLQYIKVIGKTQKYKSCLIHNII